MDVVYTISQQATGSLGGQDDVPKVPVVIEKVSVLD
jgi:hypothetical protein